MIDFESMHRLFRIFVRCDSCCPVSIWCSKDFDSRIRCSFVGRCSSVDEYVSNKYLLHLLDLRMYSIACLLYLLVYLRYQMEVPKTRGQHFSLGKIPGTWPSTDLHECCSAHCMEIYRVILGLWSQIPLIHSTILVYPYLTIAESIPIFGALTRLKKVIFMGSGSLPEQDQTCALQRLHTFWIIHTSAVLKISINGSWYVEVLLTMCDAKQHCRPSCWYAAWKKPPPMEHCKYLTICVALYAPLAIGHDICFM